MKSIHEIHTFGTNASKLDKTDNWTPFELGCRQPDKDAEVTRQRKLDKVKKWVRENKYSLNKSVKIVTTWGLIHQWHAYIAKGLCDVLQAKTVLDASADWGDRLTAPTWT